MKQSEVCLCILQLYNTALGDAVVKVFCNVFHKSAHKFDAAFQSRVRLQVLDWTTGVVPGKGRNEPCLTDPPKILIHKEEPVRLLNPCNTRYPIC